MGKFTYDINKYEPRQMIALPAGLLIVSLLFLAFNTVSIGMPVTPGIDFSGGVAVTLFTADSPEEVSAYFSGYPLKSIGEGINDGYYVVFESLSDEKFREFTGHVFSKYPDAKVDQIGESFGKTLQEQALWALLMAFILMSVFIFLAFRNYVPCISIVVAAFSDMVITTAIMDVLGITLSLGTTAALLMLIGYSVDSNILLTTRLLKRQGRLDEKLTGAFKTGFIMTTTTMAAVLMMFIVSALGQIIIIRDISAVLFIGLCVDLMNTWMFNAGVLKWNLTDAKNASKSPVKGGKHV